MAQEWYLDCYTIVYQNAGTPPDYVNGVLHEWGVLMGCPESFSNGDCASILGSEVATGVK